MPPRPTLSTNSFGPSDYIYPPFCKHCAIATVGLQLSTQNRLSRFLQPPCVLSPLPWGGEGGGYSLSTLPLGSGRGWVFPAPASLQSLRKKFTGLSVNFLQQPWSNLTAALENCYKAPGALLQGCWRNLTDTPGNLRRLPSCAQKFTCGAQNEKNGGIFIALHVLFSNFVGSKGHRK